DCAHSGFTCAQHGQFGTELQVENVEEIEPAVAQLDRGKHGIVRAKDTVRSDVQFARGWTVAPELVYAGFIADKEESLGKQFTKCFDLFGDVRRHLIRNREHKVLFGLLDFLLFAKLQHRGAGSARHIAGIDEIVRPVIERLKWNVVKQLMRHNDYGSSLDTRLDRLDEMPIQFAEVVLNRSQQLRSVGLHVCRQQMKFRELEG